MARAVDWLIVVAPGSAETSGLVSRNVLQALGRQGALINVSRGSLIDQDLAIFSGIAQARGKVHRIAESSGATASGPDAEALEQLRSLGYIQ